AGCAATLGVARVDPQREPAGSHTVPTMSPGSPHDATGIARRQFSTVRKGYDPEEVRAFLHEVSELVGRLQRSEAHERERALRAEERAKRAEQLDEIGRAHV